MPGSTPSLPSPPPSPTGENLEREPGFDPLDPQHLIESSEGSGSLRIWLLLPPLGLFCLIGAMLLVALTPGGNVLAIGLALVLLVGSATSTFMLSSLSRQVRAERDRLRQIEEMIRLRHFLPAAMELSRLLSKPMRLPQHRLTALEQLARILFRFERYDDSILTADVILKHPLTDPAASFGIGCSRAMALLRAGRLFDAGDAITRLQRQVSRIDRMIRDAVEEAAADRDSDEARGPEAEGSPAPKRRDPLGFLLSRDIGDTQSIADMPTFDASVLTLVEMYRDVQTRHSEEVVEMFAARRDQLRKRLGVRLGDVLALVAVALHRLGRRAEAATAWADATCLIPASELRRRYPEVAETAQAYPPVVRPPGLGGGTL